jgi:hypothetical protein
MQSPVTRQRLALKAAGYNPIPVEGKIPPLPGWQLLFGVSDSAIELWERSWHLAFNTSLLTRFTPAIDIDLEHPETAAAVEDLARERFGESGRILVRFGRTPRRAILLQTDEPFSKLKVEFDRPRDSKDKP